MPTHFPLRRWFSGRTQCLRPLTPSMRRLTILLGVLAGAQLLFLFWLNLTQLRYHLGYDASCDYLRAAEMYRQGKLFPDHWRDTTTSHLDSPVPLAALFLCFIPDLFTAYGLANCVFLGALVLFFWLILREMELALWARFLGISLLLCPNFVVVINANHLGYASCLLTSMQSYSGKFVLAFWFVWLWLSLAKRKPLRPGKIVALAACTAGYFVTGLSSGYFLAAYLLLPALLTSLLLWLVREDRRWLLGGHTALTIGMAAALVAGKLFAEHVLAFVSKDSEMELIPIGQLARNLLAALDGWFALLVALPLTEDVTVFSRDGILYLFGAAIALALLGALGIGCCRLIRLIQTRADGGKAGAPLTPTALGILLLSIIALANLLMLSLLNTRYGNATYEDRYLILMYCASMLVFVALVSQSGLRRWLVRALVAAFALCLLVRTAAADAAYTATRIRTGLMDAISSTAASLPSPVVFTCTVTDEYNLMMRNMRCYDLSHVYKPIRSGEEDSLTLNERYRDEADAQGIAWNDNFDHWGDYIYYDNADEYAGPITLLAEPACFEALPDSLRSEFTFYTALNDDLAVYTCNENLLGL